MDDDENGMLTFDEFLMLVNNNVPRSPVGKDSPRGTLGLGTHTIVELRDNAKNKLVDSLNNVREEIQAAYGPSSCRLAHGIVARGSSSTLDSRSSGPLLLLAAQAATRHLRHSAYRSRTRSRRKKFSHAVASSTHQRVTTIAPHVDFAPILRFLRFQNRKGTFRTTSACGGISHRCDIGVLIGTLLIPCCEHFDRKQLYTLCRLAASLQLHPTGDAPLCRELLKTAQPLANLRRCARTDTYLGFCGSNGAIYLMLQRRQR